MALNLPYSQRTSLFELITRPPDRYKSNYDKVFEHLAIDERIPEHEIHLIDSAGKLHKIINVGQHGQPE